jgi:hypothetical protein
MLFVRISGHSSNVQVKVLNKMEQLQLLDESEKIQIAEPTAKPFEARCPYLGLLDDRATALGFPNDSNHCYRHNQAIPMTKEWQADNCLSHNFTACSIFQQEALPEENVNRVPFWRSWPRPLALILLLAMIFTAALVWWPAPGKSIEESTSNAAPLSEETAVTATMEHPALSQKIVVSKEIKQSITVEDETEGEPAEAVDAINVQSDAGAESAAPAAEVATPDAQDAGKSSGGFRVTTYD